MSKSKSSKAKQAKHARKAPPRDGELEDAALDKVAGGGGTSLDTLSEMNQEQQLALQDAAQKQQQAVQTLSGIMKGFHDTAKGIIQNLKA